MLGRGQGNGDKMGTLLPKGDKGRGAREAKRDAICRAVTRHHNSGRGIRNGQRWGKHERREATKNLFHRSIRAMGNQGGPRGPTSLTWLKLYGGGKSAAHRGVLDRAQKVGGVSPTIRS